MCDEEPETPKELAQVKVDRAVRDAWLAVREIASLENDPIAQPMLKAQEGDLWSIKTSVDLVLSHMETPMLRVVR